VQQHVLLVHELAMQQQQKPKLVAAAVVQALAKQ
jgi:hypothetical protein